MSNVNKLTKEIIEDLDNSKGIESQENIIKLFNTLKEEVEKGDYLKLSVYFKNPENEKIVKERIEKVGGFLVPYIGYQYANFGIPRQQIAKITEVNFFYLKDKKYAKYTLIRLENGDIFRHLDLSEEKPKVDFSPLDLDSPILKSKFWSEHLEDPDGIDILKDIHFDIQEIIEEDAENEDKIKDIIEELKDLYEFTEEGNYGIALKETKSRNEVLSLRKIKKKCYFYMKSYSQKLREEQGDWEEILEEEGIKQHLSNIIKKILSDKDSKLTLEILIPLEIEGSV